MNLIANVRSQIVGAGYRFVFEVNGAATASRVFTNVELDTAKENPVHVWLDTEIKAVLYLADYLHQMDAEPTE